MFCKKCGSEVNDGATFCTNCGEKTENNYTAPTPFQQQSTLTGGQPGYQQTAFKGKQVSIGNSGHKSFNSNNNSGGSKALKIGCITASGIAAFLVVAVIVLVLIFGGSSEITNVQMASSVDPATNLPIVATNTFSTNSPMFNCTFTANSEPGTVISVEWWYMTNNEFITSYQQVVYNSGEQVNFMFSIPDNGWPIGDYEARLFADGELEETVKFKVE